MPDSDGAAALLAGVELGGSKCVCILGTGPTDVRAQVRIATREPRATLAEIAAVLDAWRGQFGAFSALGIASFGPLDLRPDSARYGRIVSGIKPGWRDVDLVGHLRREATLPVAIDTDVNGAALAERQWGAGQGLDDLAYVTVGTGIGVGLIIRGQTVAGRGHTELGHLRIVRASGDDYPGCCAFHGACVEGLASGPAIEARAGCPAAAIPDDSPAWDLTAHALAQLAHAIVLAAAPRRIVFGGGVILARPALLPRLRTKLRESLNGYLHWAELEAGLDEYVVAPRLGELAGPLGALALAARASAATPHSKSG